MKKIDRSERSFEKTLHFQAGAIFHPDTTEPILTFPTSRCSQGTPEYAMALGDTHSLFSQGCVIGKRYRVKDNTGRYFAINLLPAIFHQPFPRKTMGTLAIGCFCDRFGYAKSAKK